MTSNDRDQIKSLDVREQCRLKLPVWFGSRDNFYHPLLEVLANGSDEITNNYDNGTIEVSLSEDCRTISVLDSGRGIPILGETDGVKNYELLFLRLFSGTNYSNAENGKITTGTNGCGLCVINHCSTLFEVTSYKNYVGSRIRFVNGGEIEQDITNIGKTDIEHGTCFNFTLDQEVFTHTVYDYEEIKNILNRLAGCNPKLNIILKHKEDVIEYHYDSLKEFQDENKTNTLSDTLSFNTKKTVEESGEVNIIEACLSLSTEPLQHTFLNYTFLKEQGAIHEGVVEGLKKFFNRGVKKNKLTNQDIEMSFNFTASVLSTEVEYANQTKFSTKKLLYKKLVSDYIVENMEIVKIEQPKLFEAMMKHLTMINSFNSKNEESIKNIKKKLTEKVEGIGNRVEGLVDCRVHGEEAELFICEGQSALSTCVLSRDAYNQAIMAVRGKILSTLKVGYDKIFANQLIMDIIKVLGCGVQVEIKGKKDMDTFNINNLRFHKIILTADQDADGATICCLLLTMLWRLCPYLIENGYVYIAKTPLYEVTYEDGSLHYAFTDKEKEELLIGHNPSKCKIQRNKGLGELEAETMARTTMNPETRVIERVVVEDIEKMAETFEKWFATDVTDRKQYIEENLHKYAKDLD